MSKGQVSAIIVAVIVAVTGIWLTLTSDNPKKPKENSSSNNNQDKIVEETIPEQEYKLDEIVSEIINLAKEQTKK